SELEAVRLKAHPGSLRGSVIHQPYGDRDGRHESGDLGRHDLSSVLVEAEPPLGKDGARARHELNAGIELSIQSLIEFVQRHGREVLEHVALPFGERAVSEFVFHEQAMVVPMLGDASIAEQSAYQDRLLELC